jgi:hypothetical protein
LDSREYPVRQRAAVTFERWLGRPELALLLAQEFQRVLLDPQVSFEVRWQADRWARRLPTVVLPPVGPVSVEELDRLVRLADDDSFAVREGAKRRIHWWLQSAPLAAPLMLRLKQQLSDPNLTAEKREYLEPLADEARGAWLLSDPAAWNLPPVKEDDLHRWVEQLAQSPPASVAGPWRVHALAERELLDVLARDDQISRVTALLEDALAKAPNPAAADRLRAVLQWTRPEMIAEYWTDRRHLGEQHLLVGVPSRAEGAPAASYFDRIDDQTAHCVSGATLSPGDYPAMEAFPHPHSPTAFFHLVNLPTPRRRMAYTYYVRRDAAQRLAEISRRTLDRWLERKYAFTFRDAAMLEQLDPAEVSRFAGQYFLQVPDAVMATDEELDRQPAPSRHTLLCVLLVREGTHEAAPGLLAALAKDRFLPPSTRPPYRAAWCAALAIARRDPWPQADDWLASLLGRTDELIAGAEDGPLLGPTAAAILLSRHEENLDRMGVLSTGTLWGKQSGIDGYRYRDAVTRAEIQAWWQRKGQRGKGTEGQRD